MNPLFRWDFSGIQRDCVKMELMSYSRPTGDLVSIEKRWFTLSKG